MLEFISDYPGWSAIGIYAFGIISCRVFQAIMKDDEELELMQLENNHPRRFLRNI